MFNVSLHTSVFYKQIFILDYLQEMGKAVAEFLQPFGVDVDISVTDKNAHKTTDASKPASEPTSSGSTEKPAGNPDNSSPTGVVLLKC